MKKIFVLMAAAALLFTSCSKNPSPSYYTSQALFGFEFTDADDLTEGKGYYFDTYFVCANVFALDNKHSDDNLLGGAALVGLSDDVLEEGHENDNPLCVFGAGGHKDSKYYATIKYTTLEDHMPTHLGVFMAQEGELLLNSVYVNNTNALVNIAYYGKPSEGIPAFKEGDYLKLRIKAYSDLSVESYVDVTLAEYTGGSLEIIKEWKEVSLKELGYVRYLDVEMTSNRTDLPLYFCIDDLDLVSKVLF